MFDEVEHGLPNFGILDVIELAGNNRPEILVGKAMDLDSLRARLMLFLKKR